MRRDTMGQWGGVEGGCPVCEVRMNVLRRDPGVEARDALERIDTLAQSVGGTY